jgi:transposase-like protein
MPRIARKSDGRRIFTAEFKRVQIHRVRRGELTISELSRKLGIARACPTLEASATQGSTGQSGVRATPASELGAAQYIRELQQLVGKQTVELELLRTEMDVLKRGRRLQGAPRQ